MHSQRAHLIQEYLVRHIMMQGVDEALAKSEGQLWVTQARPGGLQIPDDAPDSLLFTVSDFTDAFGDDRRLVIGRPPHDESCFYVWMSKSNETVVKPHAFTVRLNQQMGKFYHDHHGQVIANEEFLFDHQLRALVDYAHALEESPRPGGTSREVMAFATGTGKSFLLAHALKATQGKHGVVIVPPGLGEQMAGTLDGVMPDRAVWSSKMRDEHGHLVANGSVSPTELAQKLDGFDGVLVVEADDIGRLMGTERQPGVLRNAARRYHIMIDEAHELTTKTPAGDEPAEANHLRDLVKYHDVLALTATPNPELYDALGIDDHTPASSMTLYDAMHRLPKRPFRPLALEQKQVVGDDAIRREALVGYFGRDEYAAPDYYLKGDEWVLRDESDDRYYAPKDETDIVNALEHNRVRFARHKNIAFAERTEIVQGLAGDLQAVYDGTYDDMEALTQAVWKQRAQSAIGAYVRMAVRHLDGDEMEVVRPLLETMGLADLLVDDRVMDDAEQQQRFAQAVRQIEPENFRQMMPAELFEKVIGTPEKINLQQEAHEALTASRQAILRRQAVVKQWHVSDWEARRLEVEGKLDDVPLPPDDGAPAYYALAVISDEQGEGQVYDVRRGKPLTHADGLPVTPTEAGQMLREGRVVHLVNDHHFVTGFTDPDVMMTQRIVEHVSDHVVRATQMLGRPIRDKDGIAAVQEIVGSDIKLDGTPGVDRHFSCYDVVAKDYLTRLAEFSKGWRDHESPPLDPAIHVAAQGIQRNMLQSLPVGQRGVA